MRGDANDRQLMMELYNIKERARELRDSEEYVKRLIHARMNELQTNSLATRDFVCRRDIRRAEFIDRQQVPPEVWQQYAYATVYPTLHVRRRHRLNRNIDIVDFNDERDL